MASGAEATKVASSSGSEQVLCSFGRANSRVAKNAPPFSRGHDFVWLLGTPLAADRSRPADYSLNTVTYLRGIRDFA